MGGAVTVVFWRLAGPSNHNMVKLETLKPGHFTSFLKDSHKLKWTPWKNNSRGREGGIFNQGRGVDYLIKNDLFSVLHSEISLYFDMI